LEKNLRKRGCPRERVPCQIHVSCCHFLKAVIDSIICQHWQECKRTWRERVGLCALNYYSCTGHYTFLFVLSLRLPPAVLLYQGLGINCFSSAGCTLTLSVGLIFDEGNRLLAILYSRASRTFTLSFFGPYHVRRNEKRSEAVICFSNITKRHQCQTKWITMSDEMDNHR